MATEHQEAMERELRRFGWELGPAFELRYATDPWVFNLANALGAVAMERDQARAVSDQGGTE